MQRSANASPQKGAKGHKRAQISGLGTPNSQESAMLRELGSLMVGKGPRVADPPAKTKTHDCSSKTSGVATGGLHW